MVMDLPVDFDLRHRPFDVVDVEAGIGTGCQVVEHPHPAKSYDGDAVFSHSWFSLLKAMWNAEDTFTCSDVIGDGCEQRNRRLRAKGRPLRSEQQTSDSTPCHDLLAALSGDREGVIGGRLDRSFEADFRGQRRWVRCAHHVPVAALARDTKPSRSAIVSARSGLTSSVISTLRNNR